MARTEAQKQAQKDYMGKVKQVMVKFNTETEPDMVAWIGKKANMQGYIKSLIIEDMKRDVAKLPIEYESGGKKQTDLCCTRLKDLCDDHIRGRHLSLGAGPAWIFSSDGQSIRLLTGRSWVQVPEDPLNRLPRRSHSKALSPKKGRKEETS